MSREMKYSGIGWIGEIPEHWQVLSIKYILRNKSIKNYPYEEILSLYRDYGIVPKNSRDDNHNVTSEDTGNYKLVDIGDFVINKMKAWQGSMALSDYRGIISPAYYVCSFIKEGINKRYIHFLLRNQVYLPEFRRLSTGMRVGQWDLSFDSFKQLPCLLPSINEQNDIVYYLDSKVIEIDNIIENTKATIEEYKVYKQALITETVTKGLNPNVPMKDSGVEWIGEIPEHWEITKLKYIFSIKKDIAFELGYEILSVTQSGLKKKDISINEGQISADYSKYQLVDINDFVMNHMDLLTGWVDCSKYSGVTSPDYRVFKLINTENHCKEFYNYLLQICYKNKIFYGLGQGVSNLGRWRLQTDKFINFMLPLLSLKEQQDIAYYLDQKCTEIDNLISRKQQILSELDNYKKSLIYECVTGKKAV